MYKPISSPRSLTVPVSQVTRWLLPVSTTRTNRLLIFVKMRMRSAIIVKDVLFCWQAKGSMFRKWFLKLMKLHKPTTDLHIIADKAAMHRCQSVIKERPKFKDFFQTSKVCKTSLIKEGRTYSRYWSVLKNFTEVRFKRSTTISEWWPNLCSLKKTSVTTISWRREQVLKKWQESWMRLSIIWAKS